MLKKVLLNKVNVDDARSGVTASTGKEWTAYPVGIEVDGMWHNGFLFDKDFVDEISAHRGQEMVLDFFEEEYQGEMKKKFQKPNAEDASAMLYDELRSRIEVLETKAGIDFVPQQDSSVQIDKTPEQIKRDEIDKYIKDNKESIPEDVVDATLERLKAIETPTLGELSTALNYLIDKTLPF